MPNKRTKIRVQGHVTPSKAVARVDAQSLLELFLADKAELTAKNYKIDLKDFADFTDSDTVGVALGSFVQLSAPAAHELVLRYKAHLRRKPVIRSKRARKTGKPDRIGYGPSTINRRLTALRSVVKMARLIGLCDWRLEIEGEAVERYRDTTGCSPEEYAALVGVLKSGIEEGYAPVQLRDLAIIRLMHDGAIRRNEITTIDYPADVDRKRRRVRVMGKWRREKEWQPVSAKAIDAIDGWLGARGRHRGPLFTSTHPSYQGQRLGPSAINGLLTRLSKRAGLEVTPHDFRHAAATTALDKTNGNVRAVARFLRHKSLDIVQRYDDNRTDMSPEIADLISGDEEASERMVERERAR